MHGIPSWAWLIFPALLFCIHICHYWPQIIDDAFITWRFSRNLANGFGPVWNVDGPWVEGFTNPSWMLLNTIPIYVGLSPILFSKILGTLCGLATLVVLWLFVSDLRGKRDAVGLIPVFLLAGFSTFAFWCVQGLETPLFVLLILLSAFMFLRSLRGMFSMWWCLAPAWIAFLTRIDAPWFLMFSVPILFVEWDAVRLRWKKILLVAAVFVVGILIFQLIRFQIFGDWLPNTAYAKTVQPGDSRERALAQILTFWFGQGAVIDPDDPFGGQSSILAGIFWLNLIWLSAGSVLLFGRWSHRVLVSVPILLTAVYIWITNGDWMPGFRFFQVSVPFLFISVPLGIDALSQQFASKTRIAASVVAGLLTVGVIHDQSRIENVYVFGPDPLWFVREDGWWKPSMLRSRFIQSYGIALGDVTINLNDHLPEESSVLMSDIGLPGWVMDDVSIIDVDGLTHAAIAGAPSTLKANGLVHGQHLENVISELMDSTEAPDAILSFEQHFGNGPEVRGFIYPRAVELAVKQISFATYSETWRGVKSEGDVWNHLWMNREEDPDQKKVALNRSLAALKITPGLGFLLPDTYGKLRDSGLSRSGEEWQTFRKSVHRCRSDITIMNHLLASAFFSNDLDFAVWLKNNVQQNVLDSDYWKQLSGSMFGPDSPNSSE